MPNPLVMFSHGTQKFIQIALHYVLDGHPVTKKPVNNMFIPIAREDMGVSKCYVARKYAIGIWGLLGWLLVLGYSQKARAQVSNDECSTAFSLNDVSNWCSPVAGFTTVGASVSGDLRACFPLSGNGPDIWFSFVATGTSMHLSVKGATGNAPGGTLTFPQVILYGGTCGNLSPIQCSSDALGSNYVETVAEKLQIGQVYRIRVSGRNGRSGSFQLCLNNYSPSPNPLADCVTGRILCSKDPLTIPFVEGEGINPFEIGDGACAKNSCKPLERQTTWLKWTCGVAGSLSFTITPLHASDDIDFIVFELGGGVQSCGSLTPVKCMSAGENTGQPVSNWIQCSGSTGLKESEVDEAEYCGCSAASNNFLSPLQMTVGKSYALAVINYSSSGHGFQISFGGSGLFSGTVGGMDSRTVLDVRKSVSPSWLPAPPAQATSVQYRYTLINNSDLPVTVDSLLDRVLSPLAYEGTIDSLSDVRNNNSSQYPGVPASGQLLWKGAAPNRYVIPSRDSLHLVYKAMLPANTPLGTYLGKGKGYVGACPTDSVAAPLSIGISCPAISGNITGPEGACAGGSQVTWRVNGLGNMENPQVPGWNYGIRFVYFSSSNPIDVYAPEGIIGDAVLSADKSAAQLTNGSLPSTPGLYYVFAILQPQPTSGGCRPYAGPFILRVLNEPVVALYGAGTICPGNSAILSATVSGGAGTCQLQWQALNAATGVWETLTPSIEPNLTVRPSRTTTYRAALLCSGTGCSEAFSNTQTVTVIDSVSISLSATSAICPGGTVTLQAQVSGTSAVCTYTWQRSLDSLTWETITTTSSNGYNLLPVQRAYYRVQVSCPGSACVWTSNVRKSEISAVPSVVFGGALTVCAGTSVALKPIRLGGIPSCQQIWQSSTNGVSWTSFSSLLADSIVVQPSVSTVYRVIYYCSAGNCGSDTSELYTVTVYPRPSAVASGATTLCTGGTAVLNVQLTPGAGSCVLQWQYYVAASDAWQDLPLATNTRLTVIPSESTKYRVRYSCTGSGCGTVYSNIVEVTVRPDPSVVVSGSTHLCPGGTGSLIAQTSGGTGDCVVSWEKREGSSWVAWTGGQGNILPLAGLERTTVFRAVYVCTGISCNSSLSNEWQVTVEQRAPVSITGVSKVCAGDWVELRAIDSAALCSLQWVQWDSLRNDWIEIPGSLSPVLRFTAKRSGTYAIKYFCPGLSCENGISSAFFQDVVQKPIARIEGKSAICAGDSTVLSVQVSNARESCFPVWQKSTDQVTWSPVPGSALHIGVAPAQPTWYRVIYFCLSNCADTSEVFLVDVKPPNQIQLSGGADICPGAEVALRATASGSSADCAINWYFSTDGTSWLPLTGTQDSVRWVKPLESTLYRATFACTPAYCAEGYSNQVSVNVAESPSVTLSGPSVVCVGGGVRIQSQVSGGLGECSISWQISTDSVVWSAVSSSSRFSLDYSPAVTTLIRAAYSCTGTGCGVVYSSPHKVQVIPDPKVVLSGPELVCAGSTILLNASVSGGYGKCALRWQQSSDGQNWTTIAGWTAAVISLEPSATMYYRAEYTCDGTHCGGSISNMLKVRVESGAEGKDDVVQLATCTAVGYDLQRNVNRLGNGRSSDFWWVATTDHPQVSGESTAPVKGSIITDVLSNLSSVPQTITYRISAGEAKCPGSVFFIQVTIAPRTVIPCQGCMPNPIFALGKNCSLTLTPSMVIGSGNFVCPDSARYLSLMELVVDDGTPDATLSSCGKFPYILRLKPGLESCYDFSPCKGILEVIDTTGPALVASPQACASRTGSGSIRVDTFWCSELPFIYRQPQSWQDSVYTHFTGTVVFADACAGACNCATTLQIRDTLTYASCTEVINKGVWATLERMFTGTDCHGNTSTFVQRMYFVRPPLDPDYYRNAGVRELVMEQASCQSPNPEDMLRWFKERYYLLDQPGFCQPAKKVALFREAVLAGNAGSVLDCGYSYSILILNNQEICTNGRKLEITVQAKDMCTGRTMSMDTFDLVARDVVPPVISLSYKTVNLSTRPDGCETSFGIDQIGLERYFGIRVSDNCIPNPTVSVSIYYFGPLYVNGVPTGANAWRLADYPRILVKGLDGKDYLTASKVRTGKHRLVIDAQDDCLNKSSSAFEFEVLDQIAPTMKCADRFTGLLRVVNKQSYLKISKAEIDKGVSDNCGLSWIRVRRPYNPASLREFIEAGYDSNRDGLINQLDGKDWNGDGDLDDYGERFVLDIKTGKYLTPLLDYVEFFCPDAGSSFQVELWAQDFSGNLASCTVNIQIEDVLEPVWTLPMPKALSCTDSSMMAVLGQSQTYADTSWQYKRIVAFLGGDILISGGLECGSHSTRIEVRQELDCGAGRVGLTWIIVKQSGGKMLLRKTETIYLPVTKVIGYDLIFPADTQVYSCDHIPPALVQTRISGCAILGTYEHRSLRPFSTALNSCYTIEREVIVINWCAYSESCGEPQFWAVEIPRSSGAGARVLVRDLAPADGVEEMYLDANKNGVAEASEWVRNPTYVSGNGPCSKGKGGYISWSYTQHIQVVDTVAPVVHVVQELPDRPAKGACKGSIQLRVALEDDCLDLADTTQAVELWTRLTLDSVWIIPDTSAYPGGRRLLADFVQNVEISRLGWQSWSIRGDFPEGVHQLELHAVDPCGNRSRPFMYTVRIQDSAIPTPVCKDLMTVEIAAFDQNGDGIVDTGKGFIRADAFVAAPIFDCNGQGQADSTGMRQILTYSIHRNGSLPAMDQDSLWFTCADAWNYVPVEIYAWDQRGNKSACYSYVLVSDAAGNCQQLSASLGGQIKTEKNVPIEAAELRLTGGFAGTQLTGKEGKYTFPTLSKASGYTLSAFKDKDYLNGVSTLDLILIQQHILGDRLLQSPYQYIAADINNSASITILDMIWLRRAILNQVTGFPSNLSWRFVPASYSFSNVRNPWLPMFPEALSYGSLPQNVGNADFIGVKIGDLNGDVAANSTVIRSAMESQVQELRLVEYPTVSETVQRWEFSLNEVSRLSGCQFALRLDTTHFRIVDWEEGGANAEEWAYDDGVLRCSWVRPQGMPENMDPLFSLYVQRQSAAPLADIVQLEPRWLAAEAYPSIWEKVPIRLHFPSEEKEHQRAVLFQNIPNPFSAATTIAFWLPEAQVAQLEIFSVDGKRLWQRSGLFGAGQHEISIEKTALEARGVLFYTLKTADSVASKKMLLLE